MVRAHRSMVLKVCYPSSFPGTGGMASIQYCCKEREYVVLPDSVQRAREASASWDLKKKMPGVNVRHSATSKVFTTTGLLLDIGD
jgi:hypothetical protein